MEDFRSRSCGHGRSQMESYNGGPASSGVIGCRISGATAPPTQPLKGKLATKSWSLSDPKMQRKKRVASYKVYIVEGKLKGSLRKSFWQRGYAKERMEGGGRVEREGTKGWVGERKDGGLGGIGGMEGLGGIVGGGGGRGVS
ncbi:hypothetical protein D8674_031650 [Pyrus ussuriensis x Pyrus communis]|uniref:Uncharacterized protein n=1 Tax=Pyrus ussuriensis x Pyrus communis TaxID=2448454 RepID=A0A5N5F4T5_9ROSA|nr:hypothetical protein D8674_031650 [Pyrus ussuriensis x Pyrus communis]